MPSGTTSQRRGPIRRRPIAAELVALAGARLAAFESVGDDRPTPSPTQTRGRSSS